MDNDQEEKVEAGKTHFHAIQLLEGALQKMNGIISSGNIPTYFRLKYPCIRAIILILKIITSFNQVPISALNCNIIKILEF